MCADDGVCDTTDDVACISFVVVVVSIAAQRRCGNDPSIISHTPPVADRVFIIFIIFIYTTHVIYYVTHVTYVIYDIYFIYDIYYTTNDLCFSDVVCTIDRARRLHRPERQHTGGDHQFVRSTGSHRHHVGRESQELRSRIGALDLYDEQW